MRQSHRQICCDGCSKRIILLDDEAVPTLSADNSKFQFDFKFGFLLPWTFRFLGLLAVIGSFPLMTKNIWLGVPLLGVGLLTVLTYEG